MAVIDYKGNKTYEGCVIRTWEHNGYDDSDWYAACVNTETGEIDTVEYDTTRFAGGGNAYVDLTAENYALYLHNGGKLNELKQVIDRMVSKAKKIEKDKEVVVVSGRKVPHGITGTIFWTKEVNYDRYNRSWYDELKIGIKDSDGNVYWTYAKNVELVDYRRYLDMKGIRKECKAFHSEQYRKLA